MVGGGQLARMTHQAAISLGVSLRVLADTATDSAADIAQHVDIGSYTSIDDLRMFAKSCDVVTFDHEHVPREHLLVLESEGVALRPPPDALHLTQDKLLMRERLHALGLNVPPFRAVHALSDVECFAEEHGWPLVAKAVSGGYDGRGVWVLDNVKAAQQLLDRGEASLFVEAHVDFERELAALCARSASGEIRCWPVVETVQTDGICTEVLQPATAPDAEAIATRIADRVGVIGVLAVELFQCADGELVVNELAMRPHNSGHWTIEGATTSQFEQHIRAVLDWPLGATDAVAPAVAMANVLGGPVDPVDQLPAALAVDAGAHIHLYGKKYRPGRKLGHVTVLDDNLTSARSRANNVAAVLRGEA